MTKKLLAILLTLCICLSVVGCSSAPETADTDWDVDTNPYSSDSDDDYDYDYDSDSDDDYESSHIHSYSDATCTSPAKCSCGATQGLSLGHSFSLATCTTSGSCSRCGEIKSALGHSWGSATCTSPKKCSRCSITEGKALGHSDNGSGKCSRCSTTLSIDMNKRVGSPKDSETSKALGGFSFYINSVDGVKVLWSAKNNSGKTVNYFTVTFHFYNPVGDDAYSQITGKSTKNVKVVGPVKPGEEFLVFSIVDYVSACDKVQIDEIKLEYADGTVEYGWYGWSTTYENSWLD